MKKFYTIMVELRDWVLLGLLTTLVVCAFSMAAQVKEVRKCLNHIEEIMIKRNLKVHDHEPISHQDPNGPKLPPIIPNKSFGEYPDPALEPQFIYQPLEPHKKGEEHE